MARTRDEEAFQAKRQEILRAAEVLFAEQGFHQTGMAAICDAVGMSPGSVYRYFESKADIIQAYIEEEQNETAELIEYLTNARDFKKALVEGLLEVIEEVSDETYGRMALEIAAEGARDPKIGPILAEAERDVVDQLTQVIERAQGQGGINAAADSKSSARVIWMLIAGATGSSLEPFPKRKLKTVLTRVVEGLFGAS